MTGTLDISRTLKAVSNPTRLAILLILLNGPAKRKTIFKILQRQPLYVTRKLKQLERVDLVRFQKDHFELTNRVHCEGNWLVIRTSANTIKVSIGKE